ncbi:MAG: MATE family efflux transporter [Pseudomonadota bacterium]
MSRGLVRELVRLGWPVLVAQMALMANSVIDAIMAGRYGTLDLAAVGIGSSIYFSVFVALMGVLLALTPIVAHLYGAGRHADIAEELRQSAWLAAALALISLLLFDAVQAVVVNVLRGYKRAVVPMLIYAVALWGVGLGGGYVIGLTRVDLAWIGLFAPGLSTPMGAPGFWLAAIASLALASSLVTAYFLRVSRAATTSAASNNRR